MQSFHSKFRLKFQIGFVGAIGGIGLLVVAPIWFIGSKASKGIQEVSSNIIDVSHAANETGCGANEALSAVNNLGNQSNTLSIKVKQFILNVRQA